MPENGRDFQSLQRDFALHLRDPARHAAPAGLDDRRVGVYRELFVNNLVSLFAGNFPVLRSLYDDDGWLALVRDWFRGHRAHTPLFPELGREFVRWLERRADEDATTPAWQAELAHYEWMEVVAANSEIDLDPDSAIAEGDLMAGRPVLSPLIWPLVYRWPVHRIRADARPTDTPPSQPTCLIIVRDRLDRVGFLEANPLTMRLIEMIGLHPALTGADIVCALASETGLEAANLLDAGRDLLRRLSERDIVLGIRPA